MLSFIASLSIDILKEFTLPRTEARIQSGNLVADWDNAQDTSRNRDPSSLRRDSVVGTSHADKSVNEFGQGTTEVLSSVDAVA